MRKAIFVCAVLLLAVSFAMQPESIAKSVVNVDTVQPHTLILLRHAKSDKSNMNMPDMMRPLEESGRREAEEMGEMIRDEKLDIQLIISSPSVRTKQTLEIICKKIGYPFDSIVWDSTLYACTGEHLISKVQSTDPDYWRVMYVGHNPSATTAANSLQSQQTIDEVKTCGVVVIDFHFPFSWTQATKERGTLRFYRKPK
jgi:phosphohistidine phosphatase